MANVMVCLGHFCEIHGPCSIFCTQVCKNKSANNILQSNSKLQTCSSCKLQLPKEVNNLITKKSGKYYITTQYPSIQQRYTALTKLIMKLLSVETTSDINKPLYLGDNLNGYVLTKIFKIKDKNARGGERKYCLMVLSDDEYLIIKNFKKLSIYLTEIINSIQSKVSTTTNVQPNNNDSYLRRSLIKPKSLTELTNDEKMFIKLHLSSLELIKDIT